LKNKIPIILYWIIALAHLVSIISGNEQLGILTKPLLMIVLGWYFFVATSENRTVSHKLILAGLVFSFSGDVNLMFVNQNEIFFLLGLVSFLITHILYILAFRKDSANDNKPRVLKTKPWIGIPVLLLFALLMYVLFEHIPEEMKIPVVIYSSVITLMVLAAINRHSRVSDYSFFMVLLGAVLFMFSDSIIAINKFYHPFDLANFFIMFLYITAQYLIVKGVLKTD